MSRASDRREGQSLGGVALRGGAAVGTAQMVKVAVQFLSVVILARLLAPEDFGLVAATAPVVGFVALFQDFGLQQAVIQRDRISPELLDRVFWTTAGFGAVCALAVVAVSPAVAWFFGDPRVLPLCAASAAPVLLGSLTSLPLGLLNRDLRFGTLARIDVTGALAGLAVAVLAALAGAGYWALLLSAGAATALTLAMAWSTARWRPGRPAWRLPEREVMGFGANLTGFNFLNYFARNLDNILVGRVAGMEQLGYYDRAYKLLLFPIQNINTPISRVMIPLLSRIQEDKPRLREVYLRAAGLVALAIMPGMAALAATSGEVVAFLFGDAWRPVAPILFWLSLAGLTQPLSNSTGWLFIAQARTDAMFRWGVFGSLTTIAAFFAGLPWGAVGVAAAYAVTECVLRTPVLYLYIGAVGPVSALDLLKLQGPLLGASLLTLGVSEFVLRGALHLQGIGLIAATLGCSYAFAVCSAALPADGRRRIGEGAMLVRRLRSSPP